MTIRPPGSIMRYVRQQVCDYYKLLIDFSFLCSAAVCKKGDWRGVWRSDAEVSHAQRSNGCCEWFFLFFPICVSEHNLFAQLQPNCALNGLF